MRLIAAIFLAGLAGVSPCLAAQNLGVATAVGAKTVLAFLKGCAADRNGCQLAVGSALMNNIAMSAGLPQVCTPSAADLAGPVMMWLRQNPQSAGMPVEDAIFTALKALYPCDRPQAAAQ